MYKLFIESIIIGLITSILGIIIINICLKFNNIEKNNKLTYSINKYKENYLILISLFFTGMLMHILLEYIGLEKWYCSKKCIENKCKIVCEKNLKN